MVAKKNPGYVIEPNRTNLALLTKLSIRIVDFLVDSILIIKNGVFLVM